MLVIWEVVCTFIKWLCIFFFAWKSKIWTKVFEALWDHPVCPRRDWHRPPSFCVWGNQDIFLFSVSQDLRHFMVQEDDSPFVFNSFEKPLFSLEASGVLSFSDCLYGEIGWMISYTGIFQRRWCLLTETWLAVVQEKSILANWDNQKELKLLGDIFCNFRTWIREKRTRNWVISYLMQKGNVKGNPEIWGGRLLNWRMFSFCGRINIILWAWRFPWRRPWWGKANTVSSWSL